MERATPAIDDNDIAMTRTIESAPRLHPGVPGQKGSALIAQTNLPLDEIEDERATIETPDQPNPPSSNASTVSPWTNTTNSVQPKADGVPYAGAFRQASDLLLTTTTPQAPSAGSSVQTAIGESACSETIRRSSLPQQDTCATMVVNKRTGGMKQMKLARFDLIPVRPLWALAEMYGRGASKYAERNWELGYKWSLSYAALLRHITLFWQGEDIDPVDGQHHLDSVAFHAMALREFAVTHPELDDRPLARNEEGGDDAGRAA